MSKRIWIVMAIVAVTGALIVTPAAAHSNGATVSTSDVQWFADPGNSVGRSQLVRTDLGVRMTFRTTGLMSDEAITIWWVVFNEPDACTEACGEDDIFLPDGSLNLAQIEAADIVVGYATGGVSNQSGRASFQGRLDVGQAVSQVLFGEAPLLKDARSAEVHLVARSHGPAVPDLVDEQTGSYEGGCEVFLNPPEMADEIGECVDIQFAIHQP